MTMDGDVVGTPAYMAPEQARGEIDRVGPLSDVYSIGAMLFFVLTEETPYVTRTERTRAATEVNKIGLRLAEFSPEALDELELPEDLRDAIDFCQKLKIRGRSRQKRLICQMLRAEDHAAITKRVEALEARREAEQLGEVVVWLVVTAVHDWSIWWYSHKASPVSRFPPRVFPRGSVCGSQSLLFFLTPPTLEFCGKSPPVRSSRSVALRSL